MWKIFWDWYDRNYVLNVSIALGLFLLQITHLFWLGGEVMATRLFGYPFFEFSGLSETAILFVDYVEIPAIFTMTLVYIDAWRRGAKWNAFLMLVLLHSQWLHIFWITDEYITDTFSASGQTILPVWLAWTAILIDYLEVPVVFDTLKKLYTAVMEKRSLVAVKVALTEE